jgi:hypothetical protein
MGGVELPLRHGHIDAFPRRSVLHVELQFYFLTEFNFFLFRQLVLNFRVFSSRDRQNKIYQNVRSCRSNCKDCGGGVAGALSVANFGRIGYGPVHSGALLQRQQVRQEAEEEKKFKG